MTTHTATLTGGTGRIHGPVTGQASAAGGDRTTGTSARQAITYRRTLAVGLMLSVALHVGLFELTPPFTPGELSGVGSSMEAVELPPRVEVPPPPEAIARPATPKIAPAADVAEDVTIAPTTFEANPVETLPPPPSAAAAAKGTETPTFIPYDSPPRLRNGRQVQALMERLYPLALKNAGIEGSVVLWIFVTEDGRVENTVIKESSGYRALDSVAERVAATMLFVPARNRDKPVAVWVAQRIHFEVV